MTRLLLFILCLVSLGLMISCGPKAFVKGSYDDPERIDLLTDEFNENDMQLMAKKLITSLTESEVIKGQPKKPVVAVDMVANRTSEHIDVKMLTDKIRTELVKSGKFKFIDVEARGSLSKEYEYNKGEHVDQSTVKKAAQVAPDFFITGDIGSYIQEAGDQKLIYYKITLNLTSTQTNIIEWTDEKQIRKSYKKKSVGL